MTGRRPCEAWLSEYEQCGKPSVDYVEIKSRNGFHMCRRWLCCDHYDASRDVNE